MAESRIRFVDWRYSLLHDIVPIESTEIGVLLYFSDAMLASKPCLVIFIQEVF